MSASGIYGFLVCAESLFVGAYSLALAICYFVAKIYWPVWVPGATEMTAAQATLGVVVWWLQDFVGVTAVVELVFMGFSLYLNIANLVALGGNAGQTTAFYNGTVNFFGEVSINATGPTPAPNSMSAQFIIFIFLVFWQALALLFGCMLCIYPTQERKPTLDSDQEGNPANPNDKPISVPQHAIGRSVEQYKGFCGGTQTFWERNQCICCEGGCFGDTTKVPTWVSVQFFFSPFRQSSGNPEWDRTRIAAGFMGFAVILLALAEYTTAAIRHVAPWPSFDSPNALVTMGLIWAAIKLKQLGVPFKEQQIELVPGQIKAGKEEPVSSHRNTLFFLSIVYLFFGCIVAFCQVADNAINQPGVYLAANAAQIPKVNNITVASTKISFFFIGGDADYPGIFSQYVLVIALVSLLEGILGVVALAASCCILCGVGQAKKGPAKKRPAKKSWWRR